MKVLDFIICDDVRQEIGNKFTLVGIYDSDIKVQTKAPETLKWPLPMSLALYGRLQPEAREPGFDAFEIRILHEGKELAEIKGTVKMTPTDKTIPIHIRMPNFPLPGPGKLTFFLKTSHQGKVAFDSEMPRSITVSVEKVV